MTFYGRLIKIIRSYFSLVWRRGNKSQMWNALIRFTHCLITLVSIAFVLQWVVNILVTKKKWQMNTPMVKRQAFSHWRHKYAFCVPPEVKWTMENTSLFQTLYQKLCKLTSVTCLSLCSAGKPNARVRVSVLAPRSHGTPRQPIYKADHKLLEVMTAFYFSGYLKFTAGGKKSFSCLTSFYCVLHKMPKWKRFSHLPIVSNPLA